MSSEAPSYHMDSLHMMCVCVCVATMGLLLRSCSEDRHNTG